MECCDAMWVWHRKLFKKTLIKMMHSEVFSVLSKSLAYGNQMHKPVQLSSIQTCLQQEIATSWKFLHILGELTHLNHTAPETLNILTSE